MDIATAVKAATVLRPVAAKGLSRLLVHLRGKTVLIVGPSDVGKTRFFRYLRYKFLHRESEHERTMDVSKTQGFKIPLGPDGALELVVRSAIDIPGVTQAGYHADKAMQEKPHVLVIMLDVSAELESLEEWLREFCVMLEDRLRQRNRVAKRLKKIVVLLNKRDRITEETYETNKRALAAILTETLSGILGHQRASTIPIVECVSIQHRDWPNAAKEAVEKIALS